MQARISPSIPAYEKPFRRRHPQVGFYTDIFRPALFWGCYSRADFFALGYHQGFAVVAWTGSDIQQVLRNPRAEVFAPAFKSNVFHIAISDCIAADLDRLGLAYRRLPLCCVDAARFEPIPTADADGLYVFLPDDDREKYGAAFIDELRPLLDPGIRVVEHANRTADVDTMCRIYAGCFAGIRPTRHDGLSNTVIEMGLMGRMVLWNHARLANTVPYRNAEDAATKINAQFRSRTVGLHRVVAANVALDLQLPENWTDPKSYLPKTMPERTRKPYAYRDYFEFRYQQGARGAGGPEPDGEENRETLRNIRITLSDFVCTSVLDVGCGAAVRWDQLPIGYRGIDVSPTAIGHARRRFPEGRFEVASVLDGDLPEADAVLCIDVLQHVRHEDFGLFLDRLTRAARKVLIIKTSIGITENYYQFNHDYSGLSLHASSSFTLPGGGSSVFMVCDQRMVMA